MTVREAPLQRQRPPRRARKAPQREGGDIRFGTKNYAAIVGALACIVLGFFLLAQGSITAAPILLVLGYCVLVPYALAAGSRVPGE